MRKLTLLALLAYCTVFASPFVASAAETVNMCGFKNAPIYYYYVKADSEDAEAEMKAQRKVYGDEKKTFNTNLTNELDKSGENCGKLNNYTGLLEKGDCTAKGQVITEITEVIAPNVSVGGTKEDPDSQIITVYAGTCCLAGEIDSKAIETTLIDCEDQVTIYSDTYDGCIAALVKQGDTGLSCSRRQWVISDSGLGIVKVVVKQIYTWGALTVGSIAVMTIILNGVRISMSGVSGDITEAKNKILGSIAGIVLLFLSGIILYTINPDFFS